MESAAPVSGGLAFTLVNLVSWTAVHWLRHNSRYDFIGSLSAGHNPAGA